MEKKPLYITLDGIDGSGKTSAVGYISDILRQQGHNIRVVRSMGTGELGTVIRAQLFKGYLDPTISAAACGLAVLDCYKQSMAYLDQGYTVVVDRGIATYYAYNVRANEDPGALPFFSHFLNNPNIIKRQPDVSLFIDVEIDIAKARLAAGRDEITHIDQRPARYFNQVAEGYYDYRKLVRPDLHHSVIPNNGSVDEFKERLADEFKKPEFPAHRVYNF